MNSMVKKIKVKDKTFVFDGRNLSLYKLTDENSLKELSNKEIETPYTRDYSNVNKLSRLTLNMSNKCNLNCKYCYANGGNYHRKDALMSKEAFEKIFNNLKERNIKNIREVKFFGGEPLLNSELVKHILEKLDKNFNIDKYIIVTNGTLLSHDFVKFCMQYNCYFAISLDGPELINDFLRGNNTHNKILNNLNTCFEDKFKDRVQLLCTYTPYHLEKGYSKEKISEYFEELGYIYNITKVGSSKEFFKFEKNTEELNTYDDINKSFDYILNNIKGKTVNPIVYEILLVIGHNQKSYYFCDELNEKLNLSYDYNGDQYICYRFWGKENYKLDNNNYEEEYEKINNKKFKEKCKDCWGRYLCTICPANVIEKAIDSEFGVFGNECKKLKQYEHALSKFCEIYCSGQGNTLIKNFNNFIRKS
ncbi:radical SAM protein (plasmid) [Haloimpatiens sp. FM7330]|uniref:radical SAM protein n=1 Tax=Haloimpatiens sp. FM7330 TaxID=3298610 RepID=UPI00363D1B7B